MHAPHQSGQNNMMHTRSFPVNQYHIQQRQIMAPCELQKQQGEGLDT